jgi:hypothetical protein
LDLVVLALLVVHLLRVVGSFGSPALSVAVGLFVILLAIVSVGAFGGLISGTPIAIQAVYFVILLVLAFVILSSWSQQARPS